MTRHPFVRLAALAVLLAAPRPAPAQLVNPDPKACACVLIEQPTDGRVTVPANAPAVPTGTIPQDTDGDYKLNFIINKGDEGDESVCDEVTITKITIRSKADPSLKKDVTVSSTNDGFDTYDDIVVPGSDVAKEDDKTWQIVVTTSGSPTGETSGSTSESPSNSDGECYRDFTMGEPCPACSSCASSSSTTPSASNGSFTYTMPLGSSNAGDTKGSLRFYTPDSSFPGLDGISAFVLPSHPVVRTQNSITVTTPTVFIEAIPTPYTNDSITITYKASSDSSAPVFRTNTISRVQEGQTIYILADSTYEGSTFRYRQTQTVPGTYLLESGPVDGEGEFTTLRRETLLVTTPQPGIQIRRETVEEADTASTYEIVSDIATTWTNFAWGWEKTQQTIDPLPGANLVSTWSYYQPGEAQSFYEGLGRIKQYLRFDGYREYHTYGSNSHTTLLPFAGDIDGLTLTRQWDQEHTTRTTTRTADGDTLSMETENFNGNTITATTHAATGVALTTITTLRPCGAPFGGQPSNISHPDGTSTTFSYERYGDGGKEVIETTGTASIGKSTTTTYNRHGTVSGKLVRTYGHTPDITLEHFVVTQFDNHGRALETSYFPTSTTSNPPITTYAWKSSTTYSCCGIRSTTDRYGVPTFNTYDDLGRQTKSNSLGITTETARKGRTTETRRYPETVGENLSPLLISDAAGATIIAKQWHNIAGTESSSWSPAPSTGALVATTTATTYNLTYTTGGVLSAASTTTTTTVPGGYQTTITHPDGRTFQSKGNLEPGMEYGYGVNGTGLVTTATYLAETATAGVFATTQESTTTTTDWAGRTANVTKGSESTDYTYYTSNGSEGKARNGKLWSVTDADDVRTLYDYNELGERTTTALDVGDTSHPHGNNLIDDDGNDQVTVTTTVPGTHDGFPVLTTTTGVYTAYGDDATATTTSHRTPDGMHSWNIAAGATAVTASRASSVSEAGVNWALASNGATATQSGTLSYGLVASLAIDGITSGTLNDTTVTCTTDADDSWLEVDFGQMRAINRVVLFNDTDQWRQTFLTNFRISARGADNVELCGANFFTESGNAGESLTWDMPGTMNVRKVKIQFLGTRDEGQGSLSLAEVQAFEYQPGPQNWALASMGSTATQSSTVDAFVAAHAIDGATTGAYTLTNDGVDSWLRVDFGQDRLLNRIVLYNNLGDYEVFLSNFRISALDANNVELNGRDFFTVSGYAGDVVTWDLPATVIARTVKIQFKGKDLQNTGFLSLREVQAFFISSHSETTTLPDGTRSSKVYSGGRLSFTERRDSSAANGGAGGVVSRTAYGYDLLGRLAASTDSRTGTTTTAYVSSTCDAVASITDAGGRTTSFTYDSRGNRLSVDAPDTGTYANITYTSYYPSGRSKARWGGQTYPTFTTYDYAGRIKTLHTWQSAPELTQNTAAPPEDSATTTWIYSDSTGRLTSKLDASTKGPAYTHTAAGRLETRTWARGGTTAYGYTDGRLTSVDYPGTTTPNVAYTHDRLGRIDTITQDHQSSIAFTYAADLGVDTETVSYDLDHDGDDDFTRTLDRHDRSFGRDTGWTLGSENQVAYTYSATGQLETVSNGTDTFAYGYNYTQVNSTSPRIGSVTGTKQDFMPYTVTMSAYPDIQTIRTYEATRDFLAVIENKAGDTTYSRYTYTVNAIGQRTDLTTAFDLWGALGSNPGDTDWGYDSLGQLQSANAPETYLSADADRYFAYDFIGNRLRSRSDIAIDSGGTLTEYFGALTPAVVAGANPLNQYVRITKGGTPVNPGHDDDGNATAYPVPQYPAANSALVWDAENRLVSATVNGAATTYLYDALSRRIAKIPATGSPTLYLYDGFNCIADYTHPVSTFTIQNSYTWGLDLGGSLQGAGGVGGLLAVKQGGNYFYPTYDGNGNISEYLNADQIPIAHFEYDPFGNTVVSTGSADMFNYRFSTKPRDAETGLYYYGYRYYDPVTGRWPSRDPIGEMGGVNLYGFIGNNSINLFDLLGLMSDHNAERFRQFTEPGEVESRLNGGIEAYKKGGLDGVRDYYSSGSRYACSKASGWVDLQHYAASTGETQNSGPLRAQLKGLALEAAQWFNGNVNPFTAFSADGAGLRESAFAYEDLLSNMMGDYKGAKGKSPKTDFITETEARKCTKCSQ